MWPLSREDFNINISTVAAASNFYKMLSYRRETALQGVLVLAKSRRLELKDNILGIGLSSTTVTLWACKDIEFGEKKRKIRAIILYTELTSTNYDETVLHHCLYLMQIIQHLGVNFGGIWRFQLGVFICFCFFLLKKSGLIFPVATLPPTPQLAYAM